MLVLTRKIGEEIVVGEDIRLTVLSIQGNRIRLGIQAPPEVPVLRVELGPYRAPGGEGCSALAGDLAPYSPEG